MSKVSSVEKLQRMPVTDFSGQRNTFDCHMLKHRFHVFNFLLFLNKVYIYRGHIEVHYSSYCLLQHSRNYVYYYKSLFIFFLLCRTPFQFGVVSQVYFRFCCLCFSGYVQKIIAKIQLKEVCFFLLFFSPRSFIFKFLIHFKLFFVSGIRYSSSFIVLYANIQISQHHSLIMFFSILNILGYHVIYWLTIQALVYIWALDSVSL